MKLPLGLPASGPASFVLNGTDEYLSNTIVSSSPNRKTFSLSAWAKWTTYPTGLGQTFLAFRLDASNHIILLVHDRSSGTIESHEFVSLQAAATQAEVRAPDQNLGNGAWYHFFYAVDTTQATPANRVKLWFNGVDMAENIVVQVALNADLRFMVNGDIAMVGASTATFTAGRVAFVQVIEGQALLPTDVGVDDGGVWKHKRYTGAFGTHGYYLNGANGFTDSVRSLVFTGNNMTLADNLDFNDVPPFVNF